MDEETPKSAALHLAAEAERAAVDPKTARERMRASLGPNQIEFLDDPCEFVFTRTGRAAGKTTAMISDALDQMSQVEGWRGCYGSITKDSGIEQAWDELRRQDHEFGFGLKYRPAESLVVYPQTGGHLRVKSIGTKAEVNKWRGKQYHRVYLDECQSVADDVLAYAVVSALPPTLSRFGGKYRLGGTPRMRCEGWWYELTGPRGLEPQRFDDGTIRTLARPYGDRESYDGVAWSWSFHNWPRAANPAIPDADLQAERMRRALAVTEADREAIRVEFDGEWPQKVDIGKMYRFDPVKDTWIAGPGPTYNLPSDVDWFFFLGADLALKRDLFAIEVFAASLKSPVGYHVDEFYAQRITIAEMAAQINRFRALLGNRLHGLVGDSQGGTGKRIFEELSTVHGIPIEKALKGDKDDQVELFSSDLYHGRVKIRAGTMLVNQLRDLRRPDPSKPVSQQPKQRDDCADAALYARRRMIHSFGKAPNMTPPTQAEQKAAFERQQLRVMANRQRLALDPFAGLRSASALAKW